MNAQQEALEDAQALLDKARSMSVENSVTVQRALLEAVTGVGYALVAIALGDILHFPATESQPDGDSKS